MNLTDEQLQALRHILGIDIPDARAPKPYRDYYCANPGDPKMKELERLGAVRMYSNRDGYEWFCCTDAGRAAAMASHKRIRLPKAKRVYSRYLDVADAWTDLTFKEFLTDPRFAETRNAA